MTDPLLKRLEYLSSGDQAFQLELIQLFLEESEKNLAEVEQHMTAGDLTKAAQATHAIKGAALNVGAKSLSQTSASLETLLEQGGNDHHLLQELLATFQRVKEKLEAHLKTL